MKGKKFSNPPLDYESLSRRLFLKQASGILVAPSLAALFLNACAGLQNRNETSRLLASSGESPRVRTRLANGPALKRYADAVKIMQSTQVPGSTDSWWKTYALIHFNFCPHGNWFFLPWHRAFVVHFERTASILLNDPSFTVPYWNWSLDRSLPKAFNTMSSPLYVSPPNILSSGGRVSTILANVAADATSPAVMSKVMALRDFMSFGSGRTTLPRPEPGTQEPDESGVFEAGPHNHVHGFIGGTSGLMNSMMSPMDPIFWVHHSNVDRIWAEWQRQADPDQALPGPPPDSAANLTADYWLNYDLGDFLIPDSTQGSSISKVKVRDIIQIASNESPGLNYTYDTLMTGASSPPTQGITTVRRPQKKPLEIKRHPSQIVFDPNLERVIITVTLGSDSPSRQFVQAVKQFNSDDGLKQGRLGVSNLSFSSRPVLEFLGSLGPTVPQTQLSEIRPNQANYLGSFHPIGQSTEHMHHRGVGIAFDLPSLLQGLSQSGVDLATFDGTFSIAIYSAGLSETVATAATRHVQLRLEFTV